MLPHEHYIHRCLALATLGAGYVAPNPMVGAVLVHEDRIIGEGYHRLYGQPHAEVNCIDSVADSDRHLIPTSTIFVSLEPCAHFGKTPPCAECLSVSKDIKGGDWLPRSIRAGEGKGNRENTCRRYRSDYRCAGRRMKGTQ